MKVQTTVPLMGGDCNDYRAALRPEFGNPLQIRFMGGFPSSCSDKLWPIAYADPDQFAARAVHGIWLQLGGQLSGQVREGVVPSGLKPLLQAESPSLGEVVRDINKFSNNVMAQQLFLTLSLAQKGVGTPEGSRELMGQWWRSRFGEADARLVHGRHGVAALRKMHRIAALALRDEDVHHSARQGPVLRPRDVVDQGHQALVPLLHDLVRDLLVHPSGERDDFQPREHNWWRADKVPILVINENIHAAIARLVDNLLRRRHRRPVGAIGQPVLQLAQRFRRRVPVGRIEVAQGVGVEARRTGKAGFADSPFLNEDTDAIDDVCAHTDSLSH